MAIPIESVWEIVEPCPTVKIWGAPKSLLGVFDLRGEAVPVALLSAVLNLAPSKDSRRPVDVVLSTRSGRKAALRVDKVLGTEKIPEGAASPFPQIPGVPALGIFLSEGFAVIEGRLASLCSPKKVLEAAGLL